jgi:hypothetical protein
MTEVPESKFAVGDIVRSRLKCPTWKKGYKQIWTERTPVIEEINSVRAKLKGNDELFRLDDLQQGCEFSAVRRNSAFFRWKVGS